MWSDKEALRDCLGFESYVQVLRDTCIEDGLAPLTLGIFGPWGSGKTSLMRMLQASLEEIAVGGRHDVKTLWFNAWGYESSDETRSALINAILEAILQGKTLSDDITLTIGKLKRSASVLKLAKFITKTAISLAAPIPSMPDFESFIGAFEKQSEEVARSMEYFDKTFKEVLTVLGVKRLVVFVDDLDRCTNAKVIETFETIKLFLNTPECTFVLGADPRKLEDSLQEVYGFTDKKKKKDFLEKIVQLPFAIPAQKVEDIVCYVGMLTIGRHLVNDGCWNDLARGRSAFLQSSDGLENALRVWPEANRALFNDLSEVREDLDSILPFVRNVVTVLQGNPRQVKRFLNIVSLRRRLAKHNNLQIAGDLLLKMTVIEYAWEEFFENLVATVDPSSGHSELLAAIEASEAGAEVENSKLLQDALGNVALVRFLSEKPVLSGSVDLRPYLFLAQTSLYRDRPAEAVSIDEQARQLARAAGSDDRIQSRAAAKRIAMADPTLAHAAAKTLIQDLGSAKSSVSLTHIVRALDEVCQRHADVFPSALKALEDIPTPVDDAVALVAMVLIDHARAQRVSMKSELPGKFETKLSKALRPKSRQGPAGAN